MGRYGGEEFLIVLPNTNQDQAYRMAERIRKNIENLKWKDKNVKITISAGLAQYKGESKEELLKLADERLYKAKSMGRNRIERTL